MNIACALKVGLIPIAPAIIAKKIKNEWHYSGIEVILVRTIAKHLNCTLEFIQPTGNLRWGDLRETNSTGLMGMIQSAKVDFGIGSLDRSLQRNSILKAGVVSFYDEMVFTVPAGIQFEAVEKLALPFANQTWLLIVICWLIMSMLLGIHSIGCLNRIKLDKITAPELQVWILLLGGGLHKSPNTNVCRLLVLSWIMATLILRTWYQASYFEHLRDGIVPKPILSLEDIDKAGLRYYLYDISRRLFLHSPHILETAIPVPESTGAEEVMTQIAENQLNGVHPYARFYIAFFNNQRKGQAQVHISKHVIELYQTAIYYPKKSTLNRLIDPIVLRSQVE
ncbi:uncharacterized protein LOC131428815 [Malaya genurostris]|uniref:uncharacterized protein LOC131428815 n=1 Tax=Malaya genurostris TaxID=325434 RepID=UPI0026F4038F|nr:uncharacterized protein LOC131428815 [Malaya genurostris]